VTVLRVESIEAGYGGLPVLRGVSLAIDRNEAVAIIGANGAGKSTLVRAICGLLPVSAGRIAHHGREIQALPAHARSQHGVAVVLENRHLFGELSVRNNLTLAAIHGGAAKPTAASAWTTLELFPFCARGWMPRCSCCPAASSRWSPSPERCCCTPSCWSWTSRPPACRQR
jgi:branched-chain amino acid transport system ATP-binding protein/nonpolar-amino-acid-transporting ATPase